MIWVDNCVFCRALDKQTLEEEETSEGRKGTCISHVIRKLVLG